MNSLTKLGDDDDHGRDLLWPSIWKHFVSMFLDLVRLSFPLALLALEALFLLKKWTPTSHFLFFTCFPVFFILKRFIWSPDQVYIVDFSCLKPPSSCRVPFASFLEHASMMNIFDRESIDFMAKILTSSGQSEETYLPPPLHYIPPRTEFQESIKEVHTALFPVLDDLLEKTNVHPRDIDILIVNCSGFCPSPSLSSIIVNRYSMRSDVKNFNISGMGCTASAIGIDMAKSLLKVHKNSYAVVLSTEILSTGWYSGRERPKLLLNCLFRMGSAAILLTNKPKAKNVSKYKLVHSLRTQTALEDKAYYAAYLDEDAEGKLGVTLKRDLLQVAGETLRSHATILGSRVLPFTEKFWHGLSVFRKRFVHKSCDIYVPNFKTVVQHFCLPASGRPVIREIGKGLKLGEADTEAALMTLYRFGNQSSSSLWYELAYMEAKQRVKKGDKAWLLGMGTGTKCISLILERVRPILGESEKGPWASCIHDYPVAIDEVVA
ncbi:3-ketoacyl-CoA synthase 6 [Eucalyptus grandis]|nr:3-ketoacyl-CoA synthase 6 [Eucalyptus grandis]